MVETRISVIFGVQIDYIPVLARDIGLIPGMRGMHHSVPLRNLDN